MFFDDKTCGKTATENVEIDFIIYIFVDLTIFLDVILLDFV